MYNDAGETITRAPDAVQRASVAPLIRGLSKRGVSCSEFTTIPVLQRTTSCCAASGKAWN
jgi:hypothetical protein